MSEPVWLDRDLVVDVHAEQLALFGGADGVRDEGLLESALARPRNKHASGGGDLAELAAAYAFGFARDRPFVDGNARAAFAAMMVFLRRNGVAFRPAPAEATVMIEDLAAGAVSEEGLTRWIRDNLPKS